MQTGPMRRPPSIAAAVSAAAEEENVTISRSRVAPAADAGCTANNASAMQAAMNDRRTG